MSWRRLRRSNPLGMITFRTVYTGPPVPVGASAPSTSRKLFPTLVNKRGGKQWAMLTTKRSVMMAPLQVCSSLLFSCLTSKVACHGNSARLAGRPPTTYSSPAKNESGASPMVSLYAPMARTAITPNNTAFTRDIVLALTKLTDDGLFYAHRTLYYHHWLQI